jgi:hypothetical protein
MRQMRSVFGTLTRQSGSGIPSAAETLCRQAAPVAYARQQGKIAAGRILARLALGQAAVRSRHFTL